MKNPITQFVSLLALIILLLVFMQGCPPLTETKNPDENGKKDPGEPNVKGYGPLETDSLPPYYKDQVIVVFKDNPPSQSVRDSLLEDIADNFPNKTKDEVENDLDIRVCDSCGDSYMELWKMNDIETTIHAKGLHAGAEGKSDPVGEDKFGYYSVNYDVSIPLDTTNQLKDEAYLDPDLRGQTIDPGEEPVIVAVLDTGLDPNLDHNSPNANSLYSSYLWANPEGKKSCYSTDVHGWNFADENSNIQDDNERYRHGTIVSQFIINEFTNNVPNKLQLMTLKTHKADGSGDLFSSICAMRYAIRNGANIINASWGFYDFKELGHPYLDSLITEVLPMKGILFVTAAGNQIDEIDDKMKTAQVDETKLRDIEVNHFYPARLDTVDNTVITATTVLGDKVSPTQNYSNVYVDMGVVADPTGFMQFKLPYSSDLVTGSSYATAILSGKIGAHLPTSEYTPNIDKEDVILILKPLINIDTNPALNNKIRGGRFVER